MVLLDPHTMPTFRLLGDTHSKIVIISGGQVGVEQMALKLAKNMNIPTGGFSSHGYFTNEGINMDLKTIYNLQECPGHFSLRTEWNVMCADLVILFNSTVHTNFVHTRKHGKPYLLNPSTTDIVEALNRLSPKVIYISGDADISRPTLKKHRDVLSMALEIYLSSAGSKQIISGR